MTTLRQAMCMGAAIAIFAGSAGTAGAQEAVVPPTNSAATQYTETFPTPGGEKKTDHGKDRSPAEALGPRRAKRLEARGPAGREVAEIVAATAPVATGLAEASPGSSRGDDADTGMGTGNGGDGGAGAAGSTASDDDRASGTALTYESRQSSGFGEVLGQATGLSGAGSASLLLLLVFVAAILWSLLQLLSRRQRSE